MTCAGMIHDLLDITCAPHVCIGGLGGLGRQALNETQLLTIKLQCPLFTLPPEKTPGEKGGKQQNSQNKSQPKSRLHHFHSKNVLLGTFLFVPFFSHFRCPPCVFLPRYHGHRQAGLPVFHDHAVDGLPSKPEKRGSFSEAKFTISTGFVN